MSRRVVRIVTNILCCGEDEAIARLETNKCTYGSFREKVRRYEYGNTKAMR